MNKYYLVVDSGYLKIYANDILIQTFGDGTIATSECSIIFEETVLNIYVNNILVQSFTGV